MAFQGDSIVCAVEYGKFENGRVPVVFTLNGEMVYEASMRCEKGKQELYPFIGMGHKGIRVLAKVRDLVKYFVSKQDTYNLSFFNTETKGAELDVRVMQVSVLWAIIENYVNSGLVNT